MRFDLHTHSTVSDGTDSVPQLVGEVAATGLTGFALTDHDTSAGWPQAREAAAEHGVVFLPGMELTCSTEDGISVHLLSYLHDPTHPELCAELAQARSSRKERAARMVERLSADYPISWDELITHTGNQATIGRPHIADALVRAGVVENRSAAFAELLHPRSPYYVKHYSPSPEYGVELVLAAGGVPIIAHPTAPHRGRVIGEEVFLCMLRAGLAGVEIDHRDNSETGKAFLQEFAAEHQLITTGSSDYHGWGKPNRLGENTTTAAMLSRILNLGRGSEAYLPPGVNL